MSSLGSDWDRQDDKCMILCRIQVGFGQDFLDPGYV